MRATDRLGTRRGTTAVPVLVSVATIGSECGASCLPLSDARPAAWVKTSAAPAPSAEASVTPAVTTYPAARIGSRARRLAFWPLARTAEERLALTEPVDGTVLRAPDDGWWCYEARSSLWRCVHVGPTLPDHLHPVPPVQPDEDDARLTPAARLALVERLNHRAHPAARRS